MKLSLDGMWKMKAVGDESLMDAIVPGSVVQTLLDNGNIDDPFYRDNELKALELADDDYIYRRSFSVDPDWLQFDALVLRAEGLDTLSVVTVNKKTVAETDNMHRTYEFDLKPFVQGGENEIEIRFNSPTNYIAKREQELQLWGPDASVPGFPHIRKAHYMFGWDWGPKIPDAGIWRPISIVGYKVARLDDVLIRQNHRDDGVSLDIQLGVERWMDAPVTAKVSVIHPDGHTQSKTCAVAGKETAIHLDIDNPQLWWPVGYGAQPLYRVKTVLLDGDEALDSKEDTIGLRTLTVEREPDEWGESFTFVVNGVDLFAKGANYIPEDNLIGRMNESRTRRLLEDCVAANFNMVRVWGGGFYFDDYFYDICDELGLVVWQDFMFACGVYRLNDAFKNTVVHEVEDNLKRLRHHASLGIICGNNEMEEGWANWDFPKTESLKQDYLEQFEVLMPDICARLAPQTFYWPASPSSGGRFDDPNAEARGDVHYWVVWHGQKPFTDYRKYFFRFCSEFGFQSFPSTKTIESFTEPEDRNIFSYVMEMHQKDHSANGKMLWYMAENFRYPKDLKSLVYVSQILQAEAIKYGVEHWRRNRGRCMGSIYWQLNDCWPVASWSSIDNEGRWKALHYFAKRFYAPILASACEDGTEVSLHVTNDTRASVTGTLTWKLMDVAGNTVLTGEHEVSVPALSALEVTKLSFANVLKDLNAKHRHVFVYAFSSEGVTVSDGSILFAPAKHVEFVNPGLTTKLAEEADDYVVRISGEAFAKYVHLDLSEADCVFSDNDFDLAPDWEKVVRVDKRTLSANLSKDAFERQLTSMSLYDSYC